MDSLGTMVADPYRAVGMLGCKSGCAYLVLFVCARLSGQAMAAGDSDFVWPPRGDYVGSAKCAACHPVQARNFVASGMARALEPIESCEILQRNPRLEWRDGRYVYTIERRGPASVYRVTDGAETVETALLYAFGLGKAGQTYIFQLDGRYYETRVSYYRGLKGLAPTIGAPNTRPAGLREAMGRVMGPADARDCFGCHATAARRGNELQLDHFESGVQCEACHGPGAAHVASIRDGRPSPGSIRTLKATSAEETSELCGACHRTWEAVMVSKIKGLNNLRFQPYRLTNSRCYSSGDPRIACTACHDPHVPLVERDEAYDSRCAACHNPQNVNIGKRTCKVATRACTSCHMPRFEVPGSHHAFADHWIRVARAGDPYPD